ncbi:MAG: 4Fe-4S dicluster domain-containing protein [Candidatus Binatia bacterium]
MALVDAPPLLLPKARLDDLLGLLAADGFEVLGPQVDQGAIIYGPVRTAADLPWGWTDRQSPGSYRLEAGDRSTCFGFAVGPHSWKRYLFPPTLTLWRARRSGRGVTVEEPPAEASRRALVGIRACELAAIAVQDRVFLDRAGRWTDPHYARARAALLLVAVECEQPAGTCFCAAMGTGPAVPPGAADLTLTELDEGFVARAGTSHGAALLARLALEEAGAADRAEAERRVAAAAERMGRTPDVHDVRALLHRNQEHPRWDAVAARCLGCTNCTLVCPTCFCSAVEETTDLDGSSVERVRRWDSCFTPAFAQVHGGNFRPTLRARYRQWLTHKFASWYDQFDTSGCVGCGRCITWCPVGIDVTEEIGAIRATDGAREAEVQP